MEQSVQRLVRRSCLLASLIIVFGSEARPRIYAQIINAPVNINSSVSAHHNVQVTSVLKIRMSPGTNTLYRITYKYTFDTPAPIFIRGIGLVPPTGFSTYLTPYPHLDFIDPANGSVLASVVLEETIRTAGDDSLDQPDLTKLSSEKREGIWSPRETFAEAAKTVIQQVFPAGFISLEDTQEIKYVTPFHALPVKNKNLLSQIALVISQPSNPAREPLEYQIHYILRDKPRLADDFRYGKDVDGQSVGAAEQFLQQFAQELVAAKVKQ